MVFIVPVGAGHATSQAPAVGSGLWRGSAGRREEAPAGVEPDECPYGLGDAQPAACPPGRGGQNGQGIAQPVAGAGKRVERVCVEPDQLLGSVLPEPVQMSGIAGATQPAAHGRWRAALAI